MPPQHFFLRRVQVRHDINGQVDDQAPILPMGVQGEKLRKVDKAGPRGARVPVRDE